MAGRRLMMVLLAAPAFGLGALAVAVVPLRALVLLLLLVPALVGMTAYVTFTGRAEQHTSQRPSGAGPAHQRGVRTGLAAAGGAAVAVLVVAGLVVAAGPATGPVLLLTLFAATPWVWRRVQQWRRGRWSEHDASQPVRVEPNPAPGPRPLVRVLASLSTPALCAEWQRSLHMLTDATDPTARDGIAELRRRYLDELERRDPAAVARWLAADPRPAGTNPARYLSAADRARERRRSPQGRTGDGDDHSMGPDHAA